MFCDDGYRLNRDSSKCVLESEQPNCLVINSAGDDCDRCLRTKFAMVDASSKNNCQLGTVKHCADYLKNANDVFGVKNYQVCNTCKPGYENHSTLERRKCHILNCETSDADSVC